MVAVEYRLEEPHVSGAGRVKPSMTAAKDNRQLGQFLKAARELTLQVDVDELAFFADDVWQ